MKLSSDFIWTRRQVLQIMAVSTLSRPRGMPTQRNIHWALGAVTWVVKAEPDSPRWEDILADVSVGGFEGFEPFTTPTLPVNDENMATLEEVAPKYKLRMSGIYWGDGFHLAAEYDRIVKDSHRFLGYLRRFGAERLIIGPLEPNECELQRTDHN